VSSILINLVRFGTSWVLEREQYTIIREDGHVALSNPENRRLTLDVNVRRGPDERVREPAEALRSLVKVCATAKVMNECDKCHQSCQWKSIVRAKALDPQQIKIHEHGVKYGTKEWLDINVLRGFHYFLQSRADTTKKYTSGFYERPPEVVEAYYQIDEFYNLIEDRSLQNKYLHQVRARLAPLFGTGVL
jgi:hypothetical protein